MTAKDQALFGGLCYNDFDSQSGSLSALSTRWSRLVDDIKGCCITDNDLVEKISDVIVILLRFRNFYAATAFLHGLQNARFRPKQLSPYWKLISTTENYVFYRLQWAKAPGLPFLVPHTYRTNIVKKARDFFEFISYYKWREAKNEDDLSCYTEGQSQAPETLRLWHIICNIIRLLASFLVVPYLPRRSVRPSLSTHGALHSDVEKGLPDDQAPACSLSRSSAKDGSFRASYPPLPNHHIENASPHIPALRRHVREGCDACSQQLTLATEPSARSRCSITAPSQQRGDDWDTKKNGQGDDLPFVDGNSSQSRMILLDPSFSLANREIGPNSVLATWRKHFPKKEFSLPKRVPRKPRMRHRREQKTEE
ncbi:hypothetical protein BJ875DRAFT_486948 [Amylocarpus encephaloides]|uniref:Uncharacterized protein n=1 Tax=Amylocarpus encephaloides TaxID=45428 RepID=A0A9P8C3Z8_9HELO|nr:hypothetical protein BJ875DRAFT_486948 [Amylocarpus encephaloides]